MNNKETEFRQWMENYRRLSESSIEKYSRVVNKISNDLIKRAVIKLSILDINEISELISLRKKYFSIKEYKDLNNRGNRMYSSGFNRLIDFLKFKHSQV